MSASPLNEEITTDSVLDAIALIEMQRQDLHRETDPEGWRNQALAKLQELLRQLEEALRQTAIREMLSGRVKIDFAVTPEDLEKREVREQYGRRKRARRHR